MPHDLILDLWNLGLITDAEYYILTSDVRMWVY